MWDRKTLHEGDSVICDFEIKSDSVNGLKAAVEMCFVEAGTRGFTHFKKDKGSLYLYKGDYSANKDEATELPYPLTRENGYDFIYAWMHSIKPEDRETECSGGDGSHGFGFTAKTLKWQDNAAIEIEVINIYYSK